MSELRFGVDVGGTFTDLCLVNQQTGNVFYLKLRSTPSDPAEAVLKGVEQLLTKAGAPVNSIKHFAHGTTTATNALIERRGARIGVVTTAGFKDLLELARQKRPHLYDLQTEKPPRLVPRNLCKEVQDGVTYSGDILIPLDETDVEAAICELTEQGDVQSIAVCLLHSYANPQHELRIRQLIHERFPSIYVSTSHEVLREFREYERFSTTVINSYVGPTVSRYLSRLESVLHQQGLEATPHISASNGGVMSFQSGSEQAAALIRSGPAAGVAGASYVGELSGHRNLLTMDMGGTSVDVCVVQEGEPAVARQSQIDGLPVKLPMIDVHSVGAGGGSIAWIDNGLLKVGPRSAGASPGPASYGRGGELPTLTDAHLLLGRLSPDHVLADSIPLDYDLAKSAIDQKIARPLELSSVEAASGIVAVMEATLIRAVRRMSVERGLDPGDFTLVAYGGAGPLHGAAIAQELGISKVLIPERPGLLCAIGLLATDIRSDFSRAKILPISDSVGGEVARIFKELEHEAHAWLEREGIAPSKHRLIRTVDMRYRGQNHEISVPLADGKITEQTLRELNLGFHEAHENAYGYSAKNETTEMVAYRVAAFGSVPKVQFNILTALNKSSAHDRSRPVYFESTRGYVDTPVIQRNTLTPKDRIEGPAIIEQMDSTTVIPPRFRGMINEFGNLIIDCQQVGSSYAT
jgi:N-methylhydantoinase A